MGDAIAAAMEAYVAKGDLPGVATLVWRGGKVTHARAVGWRDAEGGVALTRDSIFRIASMSKPVTTVAALSLWEDGRFTLDEPISRWAPEFADMRVLRDPDGPLEETDPAARPITFEDLMTHRSGLTYGDMHRGPIAGAYAAALGGDIDSLVPAEDWIAGLAALPLVDQPGAGFHYGHSTDLLGLLLGRMEGASLGEVLRKRVFAPLGMEDTGFVVAPEARARRALMYGFDGAGRRLAKPVGNPGGAAFLAERPADLTYESGGQGLWSTLDDYLKFARLFLEGGTVDGVRVLKPDTVAMMCANRLTEDQRQVAQILGSRPFVGHGFGLGLAVVMDPATAPAIRCQGGVGTVGWPGAFGGWWQADPTDGSVLIFLTHNLLDLELLMEGHGLGAFAAQTEFHGLATA